MIGNNAFFLIKKNDSKSQKGHRDISIIFISCPVHACLSCLQFFFADWWFVCGCAGAEQAFTNHALILNYINTVHRSLCSLHIPS